MFCGLNISYTTAINGIVVKRNIHVCPTSAKIREKINNAGGKINPTVSFLFGVWFSFVIWCPLNGCFISNIVSEYSDKVNKYIKFNIK